MSQSRKSSENFSQVKKRESQLGTKVRSNPLVSPETAITHFDKLLTECPGADFWKALRMTRSQLNAMMRGGRIRRSTEKRILALTPAHLKGQLPIEYNNSGQGNRCGICKLQDERKREEINKLLAKKSLSFRAISAQVFGNEVKRKSIATHSRHLNIDMGEALKEIQVGSALSYAEEFADIFQKAEKMMNALEEALTDPTDPDRYTLATRSEDMEVLWDKPIKMPIENANEEDSETHATHLDNQCSSKIEYITKYERTISTLPEILNYLEGNGIKAPKMRVAPKNVEDLFLRTLQRLEPLLKQLGEAQQAFKSPFTDADTFQVQKNNVTAFLDMLLDFNSAKGRPHDTKLELLLFLYQQNPNHKVLLSLIDDERQAISESDFSQIKEELQNLFLPSLEFGIGINDAPIDYK